MRKTDGGTIFQNGINTVVWNVTDFNTDSNITHVDGVFQIGAALDGKTVEFNVRIGGTGATHRTKLTVSLEKYNGATYDVLIQSKNYATRDGTGQDEGGTSINGFLASVSSGDYFRVQAGFVADGGSLTFDTQGCFISMKAF
jgi:hypothetical protein